MPLYEYRCKNCGHEFEIQQAITEDSLTDCPDCGEPQLRKVFQPVGISFKGSGFYKNDSRSSSTKSTSSTSSSSTKSAKTDSSSSTGDSSSSDSSATKAEAKSDS